MVQAFLLLQAKNQRILEEFTNKDAFAGARK